MSGNTRTIGQTSASKSFPAVTLVDPATGLPYAASGGSAATGPGTAAAAARVTYASDGATVPVSGPLTNAQLVAAALMTDAKGEAIRALLAGTLTTSPTKLGQTTRTPDWANGQTFTTSTSSARSSAITGTEVMISTDVDAYISIGTAGAVTASVGAGSLFIAKGGPYTFQITSGQAVAAILSTGTGRITLLPVA